MDIQEESEFNETMNLVKAVLERLEFHAFEDVLIWSNEHASKALLRCLKKTLSEFENGHLVLTSSYPKLKHFSVDSVVRGLMTALDQAQERQDNLNREINELEDQLAKAQVVPEPVLDAPACVGAGTFQKGVKWSTVIGAAQRHFKYTQNAKKAPSLDIVQVKKLVSGDFVLVPKNSLKVALSWMDEDIDPWQMGGDSFAELYEHKPILEALIEAQEQKG